MLTRAARRRHALQYIHRTADRIQLPWLCPSLSQFYTTYHQSSLRPARPAVPRSKTTPSQRTQLRHLASPASTASVPEYYNGSGDDYIPFSFGRGDYSLAQHQGPDRLSDLSPLDLSNILMLDNSPTFLNEYAEAEDPKNLRRARNSDDIEATLDACLHVRRWSRAFTLLSQLSVLRQNDPKRLLNIHNKVLSAMAHDLLQNQNLDHAARINDWVEVDMSNAGIEPDAYTFALKIKVALESLNGSKRDRTVRRYWHMTQDYGLESEVFSLRDVLSDRDLGRLSQICPLEVEALQQEISSDLETENSPVITEENARTDLDVRETLQKGLGLSTLRRSLRLFSEPQSTEPELVWEDDPLQARQRALERDALEIAIQRWHQEYKKRANIGATGGLSKGRLGALLWIWYESLATKIATELELVREAEAITGRKSVQQKARLEYGPLLECLAPEKIAATTTVTLMNMFSRCGVSKPVKLARLVTELGQAIEDEFHAYTLADKTDLLLNEFKDLPRGESLQWRTDSIQHLYKRSKHHSARNYKYDRKWSTAQHAKLGAIVCELMFDTAKLEISKEDQETQQSLSIAQPVFVRTTSYHNGRRVGLVSMHEDFLKLLVSQPPDHLIVKQLPMICPPKSWKGFYEGGFLESKQPFLRVKHHELAQKHYAEAAAARGDLDQLFAGIDVLSRTGWRINRDVFNVMIEAWNSGNEVANLAPVDKLFPEIKRPSKDATPRERWQWFNQMRQVENERSGIHSERCFQNFQMEIARAYLDETFYLPHNVDFRGRAYPIPPYLNQMGADNCRGLLLFDKGRELGSEGLRWLQIHLANVFGYDKASLTDRAQFAMDNLDNIRDSIQRPLDGKRWWLTAEDPWQCLATCFELASALALPDPTRFVSRLPVHQDGSCNGLQHYAALGGDVAGAKQVNLEPGDKPSDVYTGVCELVRASIREDAAKGEELAKLLDGRITRKVVKQTVMTNVYGVTFRGAIRQVRKQVNALMPDLEEKHVSGKAATYIARKIFQGLGALFTGAHEIQYWLGDCAQRISSSISPMQIEKMYDQAYGGGETPPKNPCTPTKVLRLSKKADQKRSYESGVFRTTVIWTTPLKLPVVQPYRTSNSQQVQTNLQHITLAQPSVADAVNKRKQLQAFPPNFIHSLDACHMVLSALKAAELDLTFSAVHDSFWTHAADIGTLNTLLREAFIRMHSEDIVGRLSAEFQMRYEGHYYIAKINKTNKLAKAITAYRKQMGSEGHLPRGGGSNSLKERRHAELLRETRKRKLMASENPEERLEGEKMVTAASLFEEYKGEKYLFSRDSLGETALGSVPDNIDEAILEEAINSEDAAADVNLERTLDPLTDSFAHDEDQEVEALADPPSSTSAFDEDPNPLLREVHRRNAFGDKTLKSLPVAKSLNNQIWLWLPLTFKPIPKKGDFDVQRLRDSTYFFS